MEGRVEKEEQREVLFSHLPLQVEMWAAPKPALLWRGGFTAWPGPGPTVELTQNEALTGSFGPR